MKKANLILKINLTKHMTKEEISEQAWKECSRKDCFNPTSYRRGIKRFKSSLQREIEKRIEDLEKTDGTIQILECKKFLELLNTVEP